LDGESPVLIYREDNRQIDTREALASLVRAAAAEPVHPDAALSFFIDTAELEAAIADAISPDRDGLDPLACEMRQATLAAADAVIGLARASGSAAEAETRTTEVREGRTDGRVSSAILERVSRGTLPQRVASRVSEGYAYYALCPETYAASAERFWTETRPSRVAVIGIRSIGASLSAIVAQCLRSRGCEAWSCTVRPRGHPFERRLALASELETAWRDQAVRGAVFAIVDEGPGISGSSFAAVAGALRAIGIPADRIVLFPSWDPEPERLKSGEGQATWRTHRRWCTDPRDTPVTPERVFGVDAPVADFSAGAWRSVLLRDRQGWPAVQPQHERWKVLADQCLIRFAGLGRYGEAVRNRAQRLSELGVGQPPGRLRHGFLELPFVPGQPLTACRDPLDAAIVGRYIGVVAREFPAHAAADTSLLAHMVDTNVSELLDASSADRVRAACRHPPRDLPAAFIDARMLAHEWIRTGSGLAKVDALDHHADHFFPGPQNAAWDLAGAIVELQMDDEGSAAMLAEYERMSGDRLAPRAVPFYRIAYAAFRAGYAAVAAETLAATDEAARFARAREGYLRALKAPSAP
jgi:hypothetical protein